jgi:hypothetical protein
MTGSRQLLRTVATLLPLPQLVEDVTPPLTIPAIELTLMIQEMDVVTLKILLLLHEMIPVVILATPEIIQNRVIHETMIHLQLHETIAVARATPGKIHPETVMMLIAMAHVTRMMNVQMIETMIQTVMQYVVMSTHVFLMQ